MTGLIVTWLVTAVSLVIISQLGIAIQIKNFGTALWASLAIGLVNAILGPIFGFLTWPFNIITLGLFSFIVSAFLFWIASAFVDGFQLKNGFIGAVIGSILLSLLNSAIFFVIG